MSQDRKRQAKARATTIGGALDEGDAPASEQGALRRGLAILDVLGGAERPLTLVEISQLVGLTPSTTHRLLQNLGDSGRVIRLAAGRFCLSPRSASPLSLYHPLSKLRRDASEVLRGLQARFGPSASMTIMIGTERMVVEIAAGDDGFAPYFDTYLKTPLHAAASGKLLLSHLDWPDVLALVGPGPYPRLTDNTITSQAELRRDLSLTRERGFATNLDEYCAGISAVGAPIVLPDGALFGALILTGSSKFFSAPKISDMASVLTSTARLFSVGYPAVRTVATFIGLDAVLRHR